MRTNPIKEFVKKLCEEGTSPAKTMEKITKKFGDQAPSQNTIYVWRRQFHGGKGERSAHFSRYKKTNSSSFSCKPNAYPVTNAASETDTSFNLMENSDDEKTYASNNQMGDLLPMEVAQIK
uniref:Mos1 transposase HTH domain-containing protein n=1 Tax=Ditylenchus dipsaci TaxID=166011 RepID=A0A915CSK8_9BILA